MSAAEGPGDARAFGGARRDCRGFKRDDGVAFAALREGDRGTDICEGGGGVDERAIRLGPVGEPNPLRGARRIEPDGEAGRGSAEASLDTGAGTGASRAPEVLEGPGIRRRRSSTCVCILASSLPR